MGKRVLRNELSEQFGTVDADFRGLKAHNVASSNGTN